MCVLTGPGTRAVRDLVRGTSRHCLLAFTPAPLRYQQLLFSTEWPATDDTGIGDIDLFVSRHGAFERFERIATGLPNQGHYDWVVKGPLADSVVLKVVARDHAAHAGRATTPGLLTITVPTGVASPEPHAARLDVGRVYSAREDGMTKT